MLSSTNRPIGIWILIVVFAWSAADGFDTLTRMDGSTDYKLFAEQGLGLVFLLLSSSIAALDVGALWVLFRPRPIGYRIVLANLGLSLGASIASLSLGMAHPELVREVYASSGARGLPPLPEEQVDVLTSTPVMLLQLAATFLVIALLAVVTVKRRAYFLGAADEARTKPPPDE